MRVKVVGAVVIAMGMAGCSVATSSFNDGASAGGAVVGTLGTPVVAAAEPVGSPSMGSFLEGPVGSRLTDGDRTLAYQAEIDALAAGDRKTWRGAKGAYGFVALSGSATPEGCRPFSHTVYIAGRPQVGKGTGCKAPDGTWRITG